jgi:hypothetical protein
MIPGMEDCKFKASLGYIKIQNTEREEKGGKFEKIDMLT